MVAQERKTEKRIRKGEKKEKKVDTEMSLDRLG